MSPCLIASLRHFRQIFKATVVFKEAELRVRHLDKEKGFAANFLLTTWEDAGERMHT